jgi:large subunit ribosomal protein L3
MANHSEKGLIARKVGMTRMTDTNGNVIPVTLLKVEEQKVTKVLTEERDGYNAYQIGFFLKSEKNLNKSDITRLRKTGINENFSNFREFRTSTPVPHEVGATLGAALYDGVTSVDVSGETKGRGFQGAIKRHGSRIGRMTHGSMYHRRTGSLGSNTTPGRVVKNKKMPGHMGVERITMQNLKVVDVDAANNLLAVKGSVPGGTNVFLEIRPSIKTR